MLRNTREGSISQPSRRVPPKLIRAEQAIYAQPTCHWRVRESPAPPPGTALDVHVLPPTRSPQIHRFTPCPNLRLFFPLLLSLQPFPRKIGRICRIHCYLFFQSSLRYFCFEFFPSILFFSPSGARWGMIWPASPKAPHPSSPLSSCASRPFVSPIETPFNLVAHFPLWLFYYTLSSLLSRPYPRPINPSRNPTSCAILVFSPDLRLKSIDPYNIVPHSRLLPRQSRLLSLSQWVVIVVFNLHSHERGVWLASVDSVDVIWSWFGHIDFGSQSCIRVWFG